MAESIDEEIAHVEAVLRNYQTAVKDALVQQKKSATSLGKLSEQLQTYLGNAEQMGNLKRLQAILSLTQSIKRTHSRIKQLSSGEEGLLHSVSTCLEMLLRKAKSGNLSETPSEDPEEAEERKRLEKKARRLSKHLLAQSAVGHQEDGASNHLGLDLREVVVSTQESSSTLPSRQEEVEQEENQDKNQPSEEARETTNEAGPSFKPVDELSSPSRAEAASSSRPSWISPKTPRAQGLTSSSPAVTSLSPTASSSWCSPTVPLSARRSAGWSAKRSASQQNIERRSMLLRSNRSTMHLLSGNEGSPSKSAATSSSSVESISTHYPPETERASDLPEENKKKTSGKLQKMFTEADLNRLSQEEVVKQNLDKRAQTKQVSAAELAGIKHMPVGADFDPRRKFPDIKAATLDRLVERLTHEKFPDPKFRNTLLLTYRSFTDSTCLMEKVEARFAADKNADDDPVLSRRRVRVVGVLKAWMEDHYADFHGDAALTKSLENFLDVIEKVMPPSAKTLRRVYEKAQAKHAEDTQEAEQRKDSSTANVDWLKITPSEFARQMTKLEGDLYCAVTPKECIAWNKGNREKDAPNISALVKQFNVVSNWVVTQIVSCAKPEERRDRLKRILDIGEELRALNNFNGLMEFVSGLNSSAVGRMKATWNSVGKQYQAKFKTMEETMSHEHNFRYYRSVLHTATLPCVPYMGTYLTDLTFCEDGNPDFDGTLINFVKRTKIARIITEIQQYQLRYREIPVDVHIQEWMLTLPYLAEDEAYDLSRIVDPKDHDRMIEGVIKTQRDLKLKIQRQQEELAQLRAQLDKVST